MQSHHEILKIYNRLVLILLKYSKSLKKSTQNLLTI
jgi:hypothetical protein